MKVAQPDTPSSDTITILSRHTWMDSCATGLTNRELPHVTEQFLNRSIRRFNDRLHRPQVEV
jgi:hypothetical protein